MSAPAQPPKLLDRVTNACRVRHFSPRTAEAYRDWSRRFVLFHDVRHPDTMREPEVNAFLSHLAVDRDVAASTQNQALAALLFLYDEVLGKPLNRLDVVRANRPKRLPTVLTQDEVMGVLDAMCGPAGFVGRLQYGSGLRLLEALQLRVKDIDFGGMKVVVRDGKGFDDRVTMLPATLVEPLREHLKGRKAEHDRDLRRGLGRVPMPEALGRKFPNADREWMWQWVFAARSHYTDKKTGERHRHHLHESAVYRGLRTAVGRTDVAKRVTTHTLRHSFATHLLENGYNIRQVQELLGHKSVETTMVYTHVMDKGPGAVRSPLDRRE